MSGAEKAAVLGGAAVLGSSWVIVKLAESVPAWEEHVFRLVNELPDAIWPATWGPMQLGNVVGSLVVVAVTSVVSGDGRLRAAALGASQAAWWGSKVVKVTVSRGRPPALLAGVRVREDSRGLGYLSGHAAVAFALASVVAPSVPGWWRAVPFVVASGVAFGRVYAGAHLPVDVIGGAGMGVVAGTSARRIAGLAGGGQAGGGGARPRGRG